LQSTFRQLYINLIQLNFISTLAFIFSCSWLLLATNLIFIDIFSMLNKIIF